MDEKAELFARIKAHLDRADATLAYLDREYDLAIALIESRKQATGPLRAKFEPFVCIKALAPLDKIMNCLAGGGIVCAIIGTPAQWIATASGARVGIVIVQIVSCTKDSANVLYYGGESGVVRNPAKFILCGVLLWMGG